ncbi:YheC/YheD family protein [Paenibacillus rigui]|uniref:ATP-grasp domain-containing protein n=1 Tax=Paenibacillus rigui TaxID=554312 RepID=A0A229UK09_9BACL|nr:YheC/YheD family protein [Paenibacillus rigui]OXM83736.1 hypothetical protein CF651_24405 [Paenibacillus rigui]
MSTSVADKWEKTRVLLKHGSVAARVPETRRFAPSQLSGMLARYGRVVAKPTTGTGGSGLILISKQGKGYTYHYQGSVRYAATFAALLTAVHRIRRGRSYLLQRAIPLARINGRPLDFRVKIVNKGSKWVITAIVGRLARPGLFVTNLCKGGTQLKSDMAIRRALSVSPARLKGEMRTLTHHCAGLLVQAFPGLGQLGFDYGVDNNGRIWILEVNTQPK